LLEHDVDINATDKQGYTPLHNAASCGHATAVRMLLQKGASPTIKCRDGRTPLDMASTAAAKNEFASISKDDASNNS